MSSSLYDYQTRSARHRCGRNAHTWSTRAKGGVARTTKSARDCPSIFRLYHQGHLPEAPGPSPNPSQTSPGRPQSASSANVSEKKETNKTTPTEGTPHRSTPLQPGVREANRGGRCRSSAASQRLQGTALPILRLGNKRIWLHARHTGSGDSITVTLATKGPPALESELPPRKKDREAHRGTQNAN